MKKAACIAAIFLCSACAAPIERTERVESPIDPCLGCHTEETPDVVAQWEAGKHSKSGTKCYVCHYSETGNPDGMEHNDFFIITSVPVETCESCHPENAAELLRQFSAESGKHP